MPYTLPAALTTAMDSGVYEPYLRAVISDTKADASATTVQPIAFTLRAMSATVTIAKYTNDPLDMQYFRLVRGALISGSPSTISSTWFKVMELTYDGKFVTLTGRVLDDSYRTVAANGTFQDVLESVIGQVDGLAFFVYEGAAAWKDLAFYPLDETPIFNRAVELINILKQKYLVFVVQDGWQINALYPDGMADHYFLFCAPQTRATDYAFIDILFNGNEHSEDRRLIYKDDNNGIHSQGASTLPIHNLGYLADGSAFPAATTTNPHIGARSTKLPVHLKYRTGDYATCAGDGSELNDFASRIVVTEVFNSQTEPAWYQVIEGLQWFGGSEGNIQPGLEVVNGPRRNSNMRAGYESRGRQFNLRAGNEGASEEPIFDPQARQARFAPVTTGRFVNRLSANDNNVQQALETLERPGVGDVRYENNANDIFRVNTSATSTFTGTINTITGAKTFTYNVVSGNENAMVPAAAGQLAKLRIYNATESSVMLIAACNTATNTITTVDNLPASWTAGDAIEITSQTVAGGTGNWVDLELTSGPTGEPGIIAHVQTTETAPTALTLVRVHPTETFGAGKVQVIGAPQVANFPAPFTAPIKLTNNVFTMSWIASGAATMTVVLREVAKT